MKRLDVVVLEVYPVTLTWAEFGAAWTARVPDIGAEADGETTAEALEEVCEDVRERLVELGVKRRLPDPAPEDPGVSYPRWYVGVRLDLESGDVSARYFGIADASAPDGGRSPVKCPRCWKWHQVLVNHDDLCDRCQEAVLTGYPDHPSVPGIRAALAMQRAWIETAKKAH